MAYGYYYQNFTRTQQFPYDPCSRCIELQKDLSESQAKLSEAQANFDCISDVLYQYQENTKELFVKYGDLKTSSNEITAKMANVLEIKGMLENTSDEFSNTRLARRFEQDVYENRYVLLLDWCVGDKHIEEQQAIKYLSKLFQECYEICVRVAADQIRNFMFLGEDEQSPTECEVVLKKLFMSENINMDLNDDNDAKEETHNKLRDFFEEYIDCCWLMTISNPPMKLNFDVVDKVFTGNIMERFRKYTTQYPITDEVKCKGTILYVTWPSVGLDDGSFIYTKGEVAAVDEMKEAETADS